MRRGLLLVSMAAGLLVTAADAYAVASLIPAMVTDLDIPLDHLERAGPIVSGFLLGYVAGIPFVAGFSNRGARAKAYLLAVALFAAGSLFSATAENLQWLVAGRTLQGLGGGAMVPIALALAADLYPDRRRALALGAVAGAQELGSLLGPVYGAAVSTAAAASISWRAVFWVNIPLAVLCAVAFGLARRGSVGDEIVVPERRPDWIGASLLAAGLGLLVLALYPGDPARSAFGHYVVPLACAAAAVLVGFGWRESRLRDPYLPRDLLGNRRFAAALGTNFLVGAALAVALVDIPILARVVYGLDELGSAGMLVRFMAGIPLGALLGGVLARSQRLGPRWTCFAGMTAAAVAFLSMAGWGSDELGRRLVGLPEADLVLALGGLGFGLVIAPLLVAMLRPASTRDHSAVAGSAVLARTIGMLVGVAVLSGIGLHRFYELLKAGPRLTVGPGSPLFTTQSQALAAWVVASLLAEYRQIFQLAAAVCAAAGILGLLALGPGRPAAPPAQARKGNPRLPKEARWWIGEDDSPGQAL